MDLHLSFSLLVLSPAEATIVSDPAIDSTGRDFTQITGSYDNQNVFFTATFRQGTLLRDGLGFSIYLNTDMNSATGTGGIGVDYSIFFHEPTGTTATGAFVTKTVGGIQTGVAPVNFATDFLSVAVPLSWLGNDDGVMQFTDLVGTAVFDFSTGTRRRVIQGQDWAPECSRSFDLGRAYNSFRTRSRTLHLPPLRCRPCWCCFPEKENS